MLAGIARRVGPRLLASIPALLGVVVLTFLLMRVLPGDPAVFFASGPNAGQEEIEMLRRTIGLDKPMPVQLVRYLGDIGQGNLGRSMTTGQPVVPDLRNRLPASLELHLQRAGARAAAVALPLGIVAALRPGSIGRPRRPAALYARRLRADLRVRPAADLCLLLPAGLGAGPDRRGSTSSPRRRRPSPASC